MPRTVHAVRACAQRAKVYRHTYGGGLAKRVKQRRLGRLVRLRVDLTVLREQTAGVPDSVPYAAFAVRQHPVFLATPRKKRGVPRIRNDVVRSAVSGF